MTEELVELTDRIKVAVQKNVDLEQKKKELLQNMRTVIGNNYKSILTDELKIYYTLARDLRSKFECNAYYEEGNLYIKFYQSDKYCYIKLITQKRFVYNIGLEGSGAELDYLNGIKEEPLVAYMNYLDTEEHALQLLERIRKGYSVIFNQFLEYIGKENEELYGVVEGLSKKLADSSTVKEEEDGTVEIHLGGKTFRGKIAED